MAIEEHKTLQAFISVHGPRNRETCLETAYLRETTTLAVLSLNLSPKGLESVGQHMA